jgi:hypothetical protein
MTFELRQADKPFFNACSYSERAFYEDWQRETGLSTYEMCQILQAQRDERDREAYEDYLEECREMLRDQAEAEAEEEAEAEQSPSERAWYELSEKVRVALTTLIETHLDETLAIALTEEQLEQYRATASDSDLEELITQFLKDDEAGYVLVELFAAQQSNEEVALDEKVAGLYVQFAREFVEKLSLGYV